MAPVKPSDGPVAVTGSAGIIGSHIVQNLVRHGYDVRACVRDPGRHEKAAHLLLMNDAGPGRVSICRGDLELQGSYDAAFAGCSCVFHAAAELGSNTPDATPEKVYRLGFDATKWVWDSVLRSGSVRRFVFISSMAAVGHPAPEGYVFTEDDWASTNVKEKHWNMDFMKKNRDIAYAMSKMDTEKWLYGEAQRGGLEAFGVMPCHVIGPLLSADHTKPFMWQARIADYLGGFSHPSMLLNLVDVRDIAEAMRLIGESAANRNGDRYCLVATDESGLKTQGELQALLRKLYPGYGIGGDYKEGQRTFRSPVCFLQKCITQLGLKPHPVEQSVKDTCDSLLAWGLVTLRPGEDNWQRKGRDLGLKSKFAPYAYPAMANVRSKL